MADFYIDIFENFFGLDEQTLRQGLFLTLLCFVIPILQILIVFFKCRYPKIEKGASAQKFEDTKKNFICLVHSILANTKKQHHDTMLTNWLVVKKINVSNYEDEDRNKFRKEFDQFSTQEMQENAGRDAIMISIDTTKWVKEALNEMNISNEREINDTIKVDYGAIEIKKKLAAINFDKVSQYRKVRTPMMEILDYHVKIIANTNIIEQFNIGMSLSDETKLRKQSLPFRRVVETIRTVGDEPRLPAALEYSVVRALKDKDKDDPKWIFSIDGLRINPMILSEKPWPNLSDKASSYLTSFYIDVSLYWLKAWISLVFLKVIFS